MNQLDSSTMSLPQSLRNCLMDKDHGYGIESHNPPKRGSSLKTLKINRQHIKIRSRQCPVAHRENSPTNPSLRTRNSLPCIYCSEVYLIDGASDLSRHQCCSCLVYIYICGSAVRLAFRSSRQVIEDDVLVACSFAKGQRRVV